MRINTDKDCKIVIYDDTVYPINGLNYNETVSLYIVQKNTSGRNDILLTQFDLHTNNIKPIVIDETSGFITICHIIIPKLDIEMPEGDCPNKYVKLENFITNEQIDYILNIDPVNSLSTNPNNEEHVPIGGRYLAGYYYKEGKIYYDNNGEIREATLQELVEVNPNAYNITKNVYNFFSVCSLRKCYIALCKQIFQDSGRCFDNKVDSQLRYKRDLVWAALNTIQYMVDSNQLAEAQRLLERIQGCNGLCAGINTEKDCGCR